jgi:uncharacterized protein
MPLVGYTDSMHENPPSLSAAIDLFNRREFFECHEILEDLWRPLPSGTGKTFLQGLLQVAVGYHHLLKGNYTGAKNKLTEGLEKLEAVAESDYQTGIELGALINAVQFSRQCLIALGRHRVGDFPLALIPPIH